MRSLADIQALLQLYYEAEKAILSGQSYTIGSRSLTRPQLSEVTDRLKELEREEDALGNSGGGGVLLPMWR